MLSDIFNFRPLSDTLLSSGMPTAEQLEDVANAGVQLVINLAPFEGERDLADEGPRAQKLGMRYINIPVDWQAPTRENLEAFMEAMDGNATKKILVHCRANYRATGFVALYRIKRLGWSAEEAFKDVLPVWDPGADPVWKSFFDESLGSSSS